MTSRWRAGLVVAAAALAARGPAASHPAAADDREGRTFAFVLANGRLQTHEVDPATGAFRWLASAEARGCGRLSVDPAGRFVYCSDAGSVAAYQVGGDGALHAVEKRAVGRAQWQVAEHQAVVHPSGRWLLAVVRAAAGDGEVVSYRIGPAGALEARSAARVRDVREIEMEPTGRFLWGIDPEAQAPTVWVAAFDAATGAVRLVEREPAGWRPMDLQLAGRFLYVANRGSGDVWGYALDEASGALRALGRVAQLASARGLAADPEGRILYVAGRSIFAFRREADGRLSPLGRVAAGSAVVLARWTGGVR